ncbi:MAG TPA: cadherin repeat domain-containing protein, partial [Verrucomicrobiae bacterium]
QFTDSLVPANWQSFSNIITYTGPATPTNGLFTFFDDGSQFPFSSLRFYRLVLLGLASPANTPPVLPPQINQTINPLNPLIVTNTATDAQSPPQTLTYTLLNPPVGASIDTNGIIIWTPTIAQAGTSNTITTIVTDNGTPNLSATNSFLVIVNPIPYPIPSISSVTFTNGGFLLVWFAPTNDIFKVQFTDSLVPANWQSFSNIITYTGPATPTNGLFTFFDDGSQFPFGSLRFYRLVLFGVLTPLVNTPPVLPSQTNLITGALATLVVTNTATDIDSPPNTLTYQLIGPTNAVIDTNTGIITWTPTVAQSDTTNLITTVVTDNGLPPLSATNSFNVIVLAPITNAVPFSSFAFTTNGFQLQWNAGTTNLFQVQWTTNLLPVINWNTFTNILSSISGIFTFTDDGSQSGGLGGTKFYRLIEYP